MDHDGSQVRLTDSAPSGSAANQFVVDVMDFVRHSVVANPQVANEPLLAGPMQRLLAAAVVTSFPTATTSESVVAAPGAGTEQLLVRRAVCFIDDNAHDDISPAAIAAAARIPLRALQPMFVQHRGCTPMEYVRRVRLHHAHLDLVEGDPGVTTVASIAARWGFASTGRFALSYRLAYGQSPTATLRGAWRSHS